MGAGFLAQLIDGTLGMAYGVSCSTLLLTFGLSPAVASASVHTAEVFTTGVSGLSHLFLQNVNRTLFFKLVIPGVLGAVIGAYLISEVLDGNTIKPYISGYLLLMGSLILVKSFRSRSGEERVRRVSLLGLSGGLLDAVGGGGWGPIVTSNLIFQGKTPQETIGTVNTAEFFVAFFSTIVFLLLVGLDSWKIVLALILGGILAAPVGAVLAKKARPKTMMRLVGIVIMLVSGYTIYKSIF
ncbi:sulfite exporter TauE/SafE family protein [Adhaeribacter radiodurans]|uniref:Probable membrane transporter protein n=2 Tax=Adhaeribacter radiodurans TaxID=2745197 RepID=A0A7L7LFN0_9BACT|nr:sulfite exporter TauE/SafE family protein [Adhaeribacter radiodurans]